MMYRSELSPQGHEDLVIYDADRPLYRQFGVSATAIGLLPGERITTVFTAVDLRAISAAMHPPQHKDILDPYHSPATDSDADIDIDAEGDGEKEGEGGHDFDAINTWGSSGAKSAELDLGVARSEGKKKRRRRKKKSLGSADESVRGSGLKKKKRVRALSPLSGCLLEDTDADMGEVMKEHDNRDGEGTDRDTELDDLLNYEINLSCLDIDLDMDIDDCLSDASDCSSDSGAEEEEGNSSNDVECEFSWREVRAEAVHSLSGMTLPEHPSSASHFPSLRIKQDLPGISSSPPVPTDTESLMRIENFRPFASQAIKKPMKRLNFIALPSKTSASKQWLSGLDSSGQINFGTSPDIVYDNGERRNVRTAGKKSLSPTPSTGLKDISSRAGDTSPAPWGSAGARRRNSTLTRSNRAELSSPLEMIYKSEAGDREDFVFNPQIFSPEESSMLDIDRAQIAKNASKFLRNMDHLDLALSASTSTSTSTSGAFRSIASPYRQQTSSLSTPHGDNPLLHMTTPTVQSRSKSFNTSGTFSSWDRIQTVSHCASVESLGKEKRSVARKTDISFNHRPISSSRDRDRLSKGGNMEHNPTLSSFTAFSLHSVESAVKLLFSPTKEAESRGRKMLTYKEGDEEDAHGDGHEEEEGGMRVASQTEHSLDPSSSRGSPLCYPNSEDNSSQSSHRHRLYSTNSYLNTPLNFSTLTSDGLAHKRFSSTFTIVSPRMDRKISPEDELVDDKIEAEIDNFIVPDELSPIVLRQCGMEMDIAEVNGIRQNALLSLPALLSDIARLSIGVTDDEDGEDGVEDISGSELGLWGDVRSPDDEDIMAELSQNEEEQEGEEERVGPSETIDRLVSTSATSSAYRTPTSQSQSVRSVLRGSSEHISFESKSSKSSLGVAVYWEDDTDVGHPLDSNAGDTDSEGSTDASKKPAKSPFTFTPVSPVHREVSSVPLTPEEIEDLVLRREAHVAWSALEDGSLRVTPDVATVLLLKLAEDPNSVTEPLETLVLLVDKLGANVNAADLDLMTPLHSLFSSPALGRFILSRGGDVLVKDGNGDSVLSLCAEYDYSWVLSAFMSMHGREARLLEDTEKAHEYAVILLTMWGFGGRVGELIKEGLVTFSGDEALELLDCCTNNFENMKEPIETFELLESLILKGL